MTAQKNLTALSAVELRRRIGTKEISPVELLEACIERIEQINPKVNALAATDYVRARQAAQAAEAAVLRGEPLGLLHGLPTGIKDLEETGGLLSTFGSPLFRNNVPEKDASMAARVRAAGAIIVAKTNTPEFGAGANTRNPVWGATGNPFNPNLTAGGSSGGSAVALACDMLPVCTGSDTGGSLRIPAALCGVAGFRPSPGLVGSDRRALGWTPITGIPNDFLTHGYCAYGSYFYPLAEALVEGKKFGAFHPNLVGQYKTYDHTIEAVCKALYGDRSCS